MADRVMSRACRAGVVWEVTAGDCRGPGTRYEATRCMKFEGHSPALLVYMRVEWLTSSCHLVTVWADHPELKDYVRVSQCGSFEEADVEAGRHYRDVVSDAESRLIRLEMERPKKKGKPMTNEEKLREMGVVELKWEWAIKDVEYLHAKYVLRWPKQRRLAIKEAVVSCEVKQVEDGSGYCTTTEMRHPFFNRSSQARTDSVEEAKLEAARECYFTLHLACMLGDEQVVGGDGTTFEKVEGFLGAMVWVLVDKKEVAGGTE